MATLIRKISTKTLGYTTAKVKKLVTEAEAPVHLYNIAGKANTVRRGESGNGPWTGFKGEFIAVMPNGEQYTAPQCFIAEPFSGMLEGKVENVNEDGELERATVEFAVEVWVKSAETTVGYEYEIKPVIKMQDAGNLNHLLEKFDTAPQIESKAKGKGKGSKGKENAA